MSDTETNRKLVTAAFEGWRDRDEHVGGLFADRMTWRIENSSLAAGDYTDRADFFARVLAPFGARFAGTAEPFRPVRIHSVNADGDTVIVYFDGRGVAKDGIAYETPTPGSSGWTAGSSFTGPRSSTARVSTSSGPGFSRSVTALGAITEWQG